MNKPMLAALAMASLLGLEACSTTSNGAGSSSSPVAIGTGLPFLSNSGTHETVTLAGVVDPATPSNAFQSPPTGERYVGLRFTVTDTGSSSTVIDLAGTSVLVGSGGSSYSPSFVNLADCPAPTSWILQVAPGSTGSECVTFAVPSSAALQEVVVGSAGKRPGIWTLGGSRPSATTAAPATTIPGVGGTVTVNSDVEGWSLSITLVKVVDPGTLAPYNSPAPSGDRYIGAQFKVTNTGNSNASTDLNSFASAISDSGGTYPAAITELSDCPSFAGGGAIQLLPGDNTTGCVDFAVPASAHISRLAISNPTMTTAVWHL